MFWQDPISGHNGHDRTNTGPDLTPAEPLTIPSVYPALAQHQRDEFWFGRDLVAVLQTWATRLIEEFKLDIPHVVLGLKELPKHRCAHYRPGHNEFGLRGEVAFNIHYLSEGHELWEIVGTLLHELLHGWQEVHGNPGKRNHHNAEFRDKAWELGLIIDRRGVTGYRADSEFKQLLRSEGVDVPAVQQLPARKPRTPGNSKLKKWSCGCRPPVNVRVAVANFRAKCLDCGCEFERQDER